MSVEPDQVLPPAEDQHSGGGDGDGGDDDDDVDDYSSDDSYDSDEDIDVGPMANDFRLPGSGTVHCPSKALGGGKVHLEQLMHSGGGSGSGSGGGGGGGGSGAGTVEYSTLNTRDRADRATNEQGFDFSRIKILKTLI